VTVTHAAQP